MEANQDDLNAELLHASAVGDMAAMRLLLSRGAAASCHDDATGETCLMRAAMNGHVEAVEKLLASGAPWNALDRRGLCAGDHALRHGFQDIVDKLVNAGVAAELLFASIERHTHETLDASTRDNQSYLARYENGELVDEEARGVMMRWEGPLMQAHAQIMCRCIHRFPSRELTLALAQGDVLNVGFGLGLIDTAIQTHNPRTHTIIEAHPDVLKKMRNDGWYDKPNVRVVEGRWQDVIKGIGPFDGIFFDTFDDVKHMHEFHVHLPELLKPEGIYSFFNGICAGNIFFQGVACQVIQIQLRELGFDCQFHPCEVDIGDDETWKEVAFKYYSNDTYYLPFVTWLEQEEEQGERTQ